MYAQYLIESRGDNDQRSEKQKKKREKKKYFLGFCWIWELRSLCSRKNIVPFQTPLHLIPCSTCQESLYAQILSWKKREKKTLLKEIAFFTRPTCTLLSSLAGPLFLQINEIHLDSVDYCRRTFCYPSDEIISEWNFDKEILIFKYVCAHLHTGTHTFEEIIDMINEKRFFLSKYRGEFVLDFSFVKLLFGFFYFFFF